MTSRNTFSAIGDISNNNLYQSFEHGFYCYFDIILLITFIFV